MNFYSNFVYILLVSESEIFNQRSFKIYFHFLLYTF